MFKNIKNNRLTAVYFFVIQFLIISSIIRLIFYFWSFSNIDFSILKIFKSFFLGLFFDIGVISFFTIIYLIYLLLFPNKWVGSRFDKLVTYIFYFITTLILTFSFFAEFTFWEEFQNRFNFIAVDYLIYTYEVVQNINQSYPIPLLLLIMLSLVFLQYFILKKQKVFSAVFSSKRTSKQQILILIFLLIPFFFGFFISNTDAEWSKNRYENEISKAGIYSFFAAFRNNELSYTDFYKTQNLEYSFNDLKQKLTTKNDTLFSKEQYSIERTIKGYNEEIKPNVIFICLESFNADFMQHFGNTKSITPNLDRLLAQSISF